MSKQQIVIHNNNKGEKEISNGLKKRIDAANRAADTAEEKIKIAYDYALEVDGLKPKDAAKVLYDRLKYSPQWIRKFLPEEAKNQEKSRHDQSYKKLTQNYVVTDDADSFPKKDKKNKIIILPKRDEKRVVILIPIEKVKKFYEDLSKIKGKAEKEGLRIYSDATVDVIHF